ncbi:CDP-diacylglycerol--glycerol-3-phosphate 3-phosphatidyltransferase [Paraferrimonas sp. SM1919]|uniref:CDP-diacylglycerol--glycerol-3-phosphate 3-phosphatidyltransferase n=1 Tax=Paraferrimonas sp. SM1919 TaxID=2662263 RepID=UPI0013D8A221|nr:CDP-diacylglycerol--glycerol-3-phosphate 3-phosphatidyltransferase [Paraferrimonas sp. SM1919]
MIINVPIALTLFRLLLIPIFIAFFYLPVSWNFWAAAFIYMLASFTDLLDGYLARKWNQSTPFGAFLDPVADKLMVGVALVMISEYYQDPWVTVPAIIMISREVLISALREWMAQLGKTATVKVSMMGKYKTAAQMMAITGLVWQACDEMYYLAMAMYLVATVLTVWSMVTYIRAAWPSFSTSK